MPFTPSHPAAVLPLARRGLVLSALVVGSMAPDFPYFVQMSAQSQFGHTFAGLFVFCVPVGLAVLWLFHGFLKYPLLSLLPTNHQQRLTPVADRFRFGPASQFTLILLSLALGAATHIVWDSFTHVNGWMVRHVPALDTPLFPTAHSAVKVYKILQHLSSLFGALLLVSAYARWYRDAPQRQAAPSKESPSSPVRRRVLLALCLGSFLAALTYPLIRTGGTPGSQRIDQLAFHLVTVLVASFFLSVCIYCGWWHLVARRGGIRPVV
jgi:hypothetical protein